MIATAAEQPGGEQAIKMRLLEQFIQQTGAILQTADVSIVPAELAKVEGFFAGVGQVTNTITGNK